MLFLRTLKLLILINDILRLSSIGDGVTSAPLL